MGGTRFMVQWEEHPSHLATRLGQLLEHQTLVDVTLMCNTHTLRVHRAVLAACSPYFETILQRQLGMHPLIVLKDMQFSVLKSLIEFMYCGETSVTEDNLGALLQAAKFFQVKGLSAMTKEALGLVPSPKSTVNGDAARKAFVGRPKRVGMQQTFVTSGLKALPAAHASSSQVGTAGNELPTLPTKTTFQTISKPVAARPDTQQQTDTAQLLLSLSGSEFPKQTFHTVSKNVRFQHNVSGSTVTSGTVESNIKKEVVGRVPVMATPNGGVKTTTTTTSTTVVQQGSQLVEHTATVGTIKEEVVVSNPQSVYIAEGSRRRGRPVKRQMNMLFQERVMTDADMALHKEAEASRKALEMLRQEMSSDTVESNAVATTSTVVVASATAAATTPAAVGSSPAVVSTAATTSTAQISNLSTDQLQKGLVKQTASGSTKIQVQPAQAPVATNSRTITASQPVSTPTPAKRMNANVVYKPAANPATTISNKKNAPATSNLPDASSNSNAANVAFKVEEGEEIPQQVYQIANEAVQEAPREENVEYQVSTEATEGEGDIGGANTNIVYQVADASGAPAGSVMSQYMEVLKEAGLPTDVPILLDSGDGSYVTVNEEVLMNIVNGGVLQCHVTEGNIVGEGVEFIVQEITEDEVVAVAPVAEQAGESVGTPKEAEGTIGEVVQAMEDTSTPTEGEATQPEEKPAENAVISSMEDGNCIIPDMEPETGPLVHSRPEEMRTEENEINDGNEVSTEGEMKCDPENKDEMPKTTEVVDEMVSGTYEGVTDESFPDSAPVPAPEQQASEMAVSNQDSYADGNLETCEMPINEPVQEEVKEPENNSSVMSVEQALQAMMGDGSDTEGEPSRTVSETAHKEENIASDLETVAQPQEKQPAEDLHLVLRAEEGTEDLQLVLSHEEELVKEERQSEISDSFTLVLDSGNEGNSCVVEQAVRENQVPQIATPTQDTVSQINIENVPENTNESVSQNNDLKNSSEEIHEEQPVQEELKEAVTGDMLSHEECTAEDLEMETEGQAEELPADNNAEFVDNVPGNDFSGENQEVLQLTSNPVLQPAERMPNAASKHKGAVISPSKDIPFAVGLLPLKTALEKLQAMPEYHPRKTRSSSTGKESIPDMPAARVKRKASSSDGPDKKFKMCPSEADTIVEQPGAEEGDDTTVEMVASASVPEDRKEGAALSMPELVTDPTEG